MEKVGFPKVHTLSARDGAGSGVQVVLVGVMSNRKHDAGGDESSYVLLGADGNHSECQAGKICMVTVYRGDHSMPKMCTCARDGY